MHQNILAILLCQLALAYSKYLENNIKTAYQLTVEAITYANESGIKIRHYPLPIFLELLYEFDRLHYDPVPQFEFKSEMHKLLKVQTFISKVLHYASRVKQWWQRERMTIKYTQP